MQKEIASQMILAQLLSLHTGIKRDYVDPVTLNQIKMWIVPQKPEHDIGYDINMGYFELLLDETLKDLVSNGYINSSFHDDAEEGDGLVFSLTDKGVKFIEEKIIANQQADLL